jgi:hypothetical protein
MNDKLDKLKREICHKGNLSQYEETIEKILQSIDNSECSISCCDTCENSSIEQAIDGSFKTHIRIGFKGGKEKAIHYIWDILHEFGHHLSGLPNGKERRVEHETLAWELALEQLKKYPELIEYLKDFEEYKENCLGTYKKKNTSA